MRNAYRILVGQRERKRILWRTRCRCEDNIKTGFKETEREIVNGLNWLKTSPLVGCGEHGDKTPGCTEGRQFLDKLSDCQLLNNDCTAWSSLLVRGEFLDQIRNCQLLKNDSATWSSLHRLYHENSKLVERTYDRFGTSQFTHFHTVALSNVILRFNSNHDTLRTHVM
jgi:hypothetical protein